MSQTTSPPFITNTNQVHHVMVKLLIALIPALCVWLYLYGAGSMIQFILCIATCYIVETFILLLRQKPLRPFLTDGSAMVSAVLLSFCLPPLSPWWLACCASLFTMFLGKHVYGGLGQNIFNPAMLGYAIVLLSFPAEFALWQNTSLSGNIADFFQSYEIIFYPTEEIPLSSATLLAKYRNQALPTDINWLQQPAFYLNMSFFIGGLFMLLLRVITWHIPCGFLAGSLLSLIITYAGELSSQHIIFHLFNGAMMIGVFFIATDPVSAASSRRGKFYYALLIGVLTIIIRRWGNFPDSVAFAVLIANLHVPLLDYYLKR